MWLFKLGSGTSSRIPGELSWPIIFLISSLVLDLLQYIVATAVWGEFNRRMEIKLGEDVEKEFTAPSYANWPALFFFWLKIVTALVGNVWLLIFLARIVLS